MKKYALDTSSNAIKEQLVRADEREDTTTVSIWIAVSGQADSGRYIYARNIDGLPFLHCCSQGIVTALLKDTRPNNAMTRGTTLCLLNTFDEAVAAMVSSQPSCQHSMLPAQT